MDQLLANLDAALRAALPVVGVARAKEAGQPTSLTSWHTRPEGAFRLDWSSSPTAAELASAAALVAAASGQPSASEQLDVLGGRVLAALCVLAQPGAATANQLAAAQQLVKMVSAKALTILPK